MAVLSSGEDGRAHGREEGREWGGTVDARAEGNRVEGGTGGGDNAWEGGVAAGEGHAEDDVVGVGGAGGVEKSEGYLSVNGEGEVGRAGGETDAVADDGGCSAGRRDGRRPAGCRAVFECGLPEGEGRGEGKMGQV